MLLNSRFIETLIEDVIAANQYYNSKFKELKDKYKELKDSFVQELENVQGR